MITILPTTNLVKWYGKVEDERPPCLSCGLYIINFGGTAEVVDSESGEIGIICGHCTGKARERYESLEELLVDTDGEERGRAVQEVLDKQRAERAKEFRSERAKRGARTKAEARSRARDESGDSEVGRRVRVRKPDPTRNTKVRKPKGSSLSGVATPRDRSSSD